MNHETRMGRYSAALAALLLCLAASTLLAEGRPPAASVGPAASLSVVLGRPTDRSVTLSVMSAADIEARVEYGDGPAAYTEKTEYRTARAGVPLEFEISALKPNARYYYRLLARPPGTGDFRPEPESTFHTQRRPGSTFTFALQGDSHPDRAGKMFAPDLYAQTLRNVAADRPDFYLTMGDDFSIERLIAGQAPSQAAVNQVYARHGLRRRARAVQGRPAGRRVLPPHPADDRRHRRSRAGQGGVGSQRLPSRPLRRRIRATSHAGRRRRKFHIRRPGVRAHQPRPR